ncbi:Modification methylase DpnIIA [Porphyromonas crevioricanis]|uniref:site-specific DNA-methyltransferase (adenine-specific) n=1 Tax=Porphyromonas crevioricanis TaxID=393921 RepID=A0A2X4PYQ8_9PORP|nr:Dam family site-specific DNA-(adenine-N6)-methyltransferase [Porphyromonas crevioricanis]GAD07120.1 methyl-directed repair DNA adenine methylase [Porphyromonas crevioricanis JCM 13913]SQH73037.1 Modification methylase DpnIIA [Porphyromonas crevioricanis]
MKPLLKYRGGKSREIENFIHFIPEDYERYIEPFAGGASLFFYLEPSKALINDINPRLIDFYLSVRDDFHQLKTELMNLEQVYRFNQNEYEIAKSSTSPFDYIENKNEELYYQIRDMFNGKVTKEYLDATLYYFINKIAFSGMLRFNSKGEYNVPFGRYKKFNTELVSEAHRDLLQRAEILQLDYSDIFSKCTTSDFLFLDPPYDCIFTDYGNIHQDDFSEKNHIALANDFRNLPAKTMMVIGKTDLIEELYRPFIRAEYSKQYAVNIRNRFKSESTHLIITNYNI